MKIYNHLHTGIPESWEEVFSEADEGILHACQRLEADKIDYFPRAEDVFNCFRLVKMQDVKVVIVGQGPYHTKRGLAHGLCFSSLVGVPPSLQAIYQELKNTIGGFVPPKHGDLTSWAKQGVLLLNVTLTVKNGQTDYLPALWMTLIDTVVNKLTNRNKRIIWMLFGQKAQALTKIIGSKGIKLLAAHPSPKNESGGFIGCGHFLTCNRELIKIGLEQVDWTL